jgi:hypothetical protein
MQGAWLAELFLTEVFWGNYSMISPRVLLIALADILAF